MFLAVPVYPEKIFEVPNDLTTCCFNIFFNPMPARNIISLFQPCHGILRVRQHRSRTYFPYSYHFDFVKRLCKFNIHPFCQQIFIPACNPELLFCSDATPQSQGLHSPPPLVLGLAWIGLYWVEYF